MIEEHGHLQATARVLGFALTFLSARPSEIEASLAALTPATVDGFVVTDDAFLEPLLRVLSRLPPTVVCQPSIRLVMRSSKVG